MTLHQPKPWGRYKSAALKARKIARQKRRREETKDVEALIDHHVDVSHRLREAQAAVTAVPTGQDAGALKGTVRTLRAEQARAKHAATQARVRARKHDLHLQTALAAAEITAAARKRDRRQQQRWVDCQIMKKFNSTLVLAAKCPRGRAARLEASPSHSRSSSLGSDWDVPVVSALDDAWDDNALDQADNCFDVDDNDEYHDDPPEDDTSDASEGEIPTTTHPRPPPPLRLRHHTHHKPYPSLSLIGTSTSASVLQSALLLVLGPASIRRLRASYIACDASRNALCGKGNLNTRRKSPSLRSHSTTTSA